MAGVLFVIHIPSTSFEKKYNHFIENFEESDGNVERSKNIGHIGTPHGIPDLQPRKGPLKVYESCEGKINDVDSEGIFIEVPILVEKPYHTEIDVFNQITNDVIGQRCSTIDPSTKLKKSWEGLKVLVTSSKKEAGDNETGELKISPSSSMEQVMIEIIKFMSISNSAWVESNKGNGYQITFSIDSGKRCDEIIHLLKEWGIGERKHSTVSILPCSLYFDPNEHVEEEEKAESNNFDKEGGGWSKFLSSVRARLNVAQIVEEVKHDAAITFDFVCLVVVASILAAFGLVENSTLFLAASMLISPLMGPIIAAIFGTVIKDFKLQNLGVINEMIGVFLSTFVGFIFGLVIIMTDDKYQSGDGLSHEMLSRCELHSVVVGIFIALASGAAVAIAILGENIGSLVGVAISASLLPPAVNAGVIWAFAFMYTIFERISSNTFTVTNSTTYSDNQSMELSILGSVSMCLTITNVFAVYIMGVLFLKIKEVAPVVSRNQRQFWKHDIKIARDYNKTLHSDDAISLAKQLNDERHHNEQENFRAFGPDYFRQGGVSHQNTWSPMSTRHHFQHKESTRPTIHDLEALYFTLAGQSNNNESHHHSTYMPHHHTHHTHSYLFPKIPSNFVRACKNWTPTRYAAISNEQNSHSPNFGRRSSIPIDVKCSKVQIDSLRSSSAPLSKIIEQASASKTPNNSKIDEPQLSSQKQGKKFIVTPCQDPLVKDE